MKYVVVTRGVVSGIGKGVTASSIGLILKSCGFRVTAIKIGSLSTFHAYPYLNIDVGTMSPIEHGEVYVLDDGGEVDLDLGSYERFMDIKLTSDNNWKSFISLFLISQMLFKNGSSAQLRSQWMDNQVHMMFVS
ncbi:unnamed protein product [Cochlearia groenlandica]